jgi:hypothetical protein
MSEPGLHQKAHPAETVKEHVKQTEKTQISAPVMKSPIRSLPMPLERHQGERQKANADLRGPGCSLSHVWNLTRRSAKENVMSFVDKVKGKAKDELDSLDLTPSSENQPLVVDRIAVYLSGDAELNGVRRTCYEL